MGGIWHMFAGSKNWALYQDIPNCTSPSDLTCRLMRSMVRYGAYSSYVQHRVIQAQYFKNPRNLQGLFYYFVRVFVFNKDIKDTQPRRAGLQCFKPNSIQEKKLKIAKNFFFFFFWAGYLEHTIFLPEITNELENSKNETYRENLSSLDAFVMIRFADDAMVKPGETAVSYYVLYRSKQQSIKFYQLNWC